MLTLNTEQKAKVTVRPLTAKGNPALVDGPPGWSITNPAILTLVVAPDGLSADVFGVSAGTGSVIVSADADLTDGVSEIVGSLTVAVTPALAASLVLEAGTPVSV
jgi:hypothetical protein